MTRLVGIERKQGEYEGRPYDNHVLHCVTDEKTKAWVAGDMTFTVKIKSADFPLIFDKDIECGDAIIISYNRFGNVEAVIPAGN